MKRRAFVTGATGQTGSYLVELLLAKGYEVAILLRRSSSTTQQCWRIAQCLSQLTIIEGDVLDTSSLRQALLFHPQEVYHLAAQSYVQRSFTEPLHTLDVTAGGTLRLLDAIRLYTSITDSVRFYQASSSEQYGNALTSPQFEGTPMAPVSPYGCAKLLAHQVCHIYRESYGMFIACGIAFNHESPRRGEEFVTRRLTKGAAQVKLGIIQQLPFYLPDPIPSRDWSHAKDIVEGIWLMLQHHLPRDFVLASGQTHTVVEFAEQAFQQLGLRFQDCITIDERLRRPQELTTLVGDSRLAREVLGWYPQITFPQLVKEMVDADLARETEALHHRAQSDTECHRPQTVAALTLSADLHGL